MKTFDKSFKQQQPIDEAAIAAAVQVMRSGRLHRYNRVDTELTETDYLEQEFAHSMGVNYALACSSCGYALSIALRAVGVQKGDSVLCNAFTLSPVPGAIHSSGGKAVLVEMDDHFCIDLADLARQAKQSKARYLLLSHMRGHIVDMTQLMAIAKANQLTVIEDCAHTMGAAWDGQPSGSFGDVACFSTQTYKHINSGEGGLLVTPHDDVMAKAIIYSGSYMFFNEHQAAPPLSAFDGLYEQIPNCSGRMDNLRAAILRPQLAEMPQRREQWNARYHAVEEQLRRCDAVAIPKREAKEQFVGSSIQFRLPDFTATQMQQVVEQCQQRGVMLKWFGEAQPKGYTSQYSDWAYLGDMPTLAQTTHLLSTFVDMRIPLTFSLADCQLIGEIITAVVDDIRTSAQPQKTGESA